MKIITRGLPIAWGLLPIVGGYGVLLATGNAGWGLVAMVATAMLPLWWIPLILLLAWSLDAERLYK